MKPKPVAPLNPSRTSREPGPPQPDRQDPETPLAKLASPYEESAIRDKALEILRREFPPTAAAETVTADSRSSTLQDEASGEIDPEAPSDLPLPSATSHAPTSELNIPPSAFTGPIPARMMNEFVYCPRLFYYEFVEGVFVESADTLREGAIHQRLDSGNGALPAAAKKRKAEEKSSSANPGNTEGTSPQPSPQGGEGDGELGTIHSRSVQMGSDRLGIVAKMDLVEALGSHLHIIHFERHTDLARARLLRRVRPQLHRDKARLQCIDAVNRQLSNLKM